MTWALAGAALVASAPAALRWLRVSQREHYLAPAVTRFACRWWTTGWANRLLAAVAVAGVVGSLWTVWAGFAVVVAQIGPVGLGLRGTSSPLLWTERLKRLAAGTAAILSLVYLVGGLLEQPVVIAIGLFLLPAVVDLTSSLLGPVESRLGNRWVEKAAGKLKASGAKVVAITGSYGKTTTKAYVAHLLEGSLRTVASPASFNNRMGLARGINEHLVPGTEVFVAEMGTYGPGEIAELCEWIPPDVAALVAVGPVHLERFRTEERIVESKAEILDRADIAVIAVDHPLLSDLAVERSAAIDVLTASASEKEAKVRVFDDRLYVDEVEVGRPETDTLEINLAVAVGVGLALGISTDTLAGRLEGLPRPDHRQTVSVAEKGFSIIDDTYNSNPAGGIAGIERLERVGAGGRTVVVTPGMVELGARQRSENAAFAARAVAAVDDLVIVGATNRAALLEGSADGRASVTVVDSREEAVAWVRAHLGQGDAVLYENDLPDHYP